MSRGSISAYDVPDRIATYDADMDMMHPNRHAMVAVALEVLPFPGDAPLRVLDLGSGTGFFTAAVLDAFPAARVIAVDGAASMVDTARQRLGRAAARVDFRVADFRYLERFLRDGEQGDLVVSSYALHHLTADEKRRTVAAAVDYLRPGGWFVNADLVVGETEYLEARNQALRAEGIARRAAEGDARFATTSDVHAFLKELEAKEGDQPLTVTADLEILRAAGLGHAGIFWLEYREAVTGGMK